MTFPLPGVPEPADNLRVARDFIDSGNNAGPGLITSSLFCHSPYTCSAATLQGAKALTRENNLPFFIHLAETRHEVEQSRRQRGMSPVAYLDSLGLLDENTVAVHVVWVDETDRKLLADRRVKVCHCPESNLKLASGIAPVADLLDRGLAVGLGTDGAASNNNLDLWGEMSLAAKLHKVASLDPYGIAGPAGGGNGYSGGSPSPGSRSGDRIPDPGKSSGSYRHRPASAPPDADV